MLFFLALGLVVASSSASGVTPNSRGSSFNLLGFLNRYNTGISAAYRQQKYDKLCTSPFVFHRGTAPLWFKDWSNNGALRQFGGSSETKTWIQGDLHIENFGTFKNHDGTVVYEMNDFDEACKADYQHDLLKLATSIVLVTEELQLPLEVAEECVEKLAKAYRKTNKEFAEAVYAKPKQTQFTKEGTSGPLEKLISKVEKKKTRVKMLNKWTSVSSSGQRTFRMIQGRTTRAPAGVVQALQSAWPHYIATTDHADKQKYFEIIDIVQRLGAGTGSLGKDRYYVLVRGKSDGVDDDHIVDVKEGGVPVVVAFMNGADKAAYEAANPNEGVRHDKAYRAVSTDTDDFLGHLSMRGKRFFVRERSPAKDSFEYLEDGTAENMLDMCKWWGRILATQHARAAKKFPKNFVKVAGPGKKEEFLAFVRDVAFSYARQVNADYNTFKSQHGC